MTLQEMFSAAAADHLKFEKVENPLSQRPDLAAFLLLDSLLPGSDDIIVASEHDEFYLSIDCKELAKVATQEHVLTLVRCGVRYSHYHDCLCMFS